MSDTEAKCPKCGATIPYPNAYCARCGHSPLVPQRPRRAGMVGSILAFIFIGVPAGVCGGCFLAFSGMGPTDAPTIALSIGGLALFVLLLGLMIRNMVSK